MIWCKKKCFCSRLVRVKSVLPQYPFLNSTFFWGIIWTDRFNRKRRKCCCILLMTPSRTFGIAIIPWDRWQSTEFYGLHVELCLEVQSLGPSLLSFVVCNMGLLWSVVVMTPTMLWLLVEWLVQHLAWQVICIYFCLLLLHKSLFTTLPTYSDVSSSSGMRHSTS